MAGEDLIMASQEELKRPHVIRKVMEKVIRQVRAAEILSLSVRQIRRLVQWVKVEGDREIVHKSKGRPSNRRFSDRIKDRVIKLYRERYKGFGPTLASEKLLEKRDLFGFFEPTYINEIGKFSFPMPEAALGFHPGMQEFFLDGRASIRKEHLELG